MKPSGFIKKYQGRVLQDDGCFKSQEFLRFSRDFRSTVKDIATELGGEVEAFHVGHYDVSGFIHRDGKHVFFSYSEPRHMPIDLLRDDCMQGILIRTAKDARDSTGGMNHFCNIINMKGAADKLLA